MSLSVVFHGARDGDDGPFQLASATGWARFGEWVGSLPANFKHLQILADTGEVKNSVAVSGELNAALVFHPPQNPNVADTARQFQEVLGAGDMDETVTVSADAEAPVPNEVTSNAQPLDAAMSTLDLFLRSGVPVVQNAFCPTGEGGGVDPSCSPGGQGGAAPREYKVGDKVHYSMAPGVEYKVDGVKGGLVSIRRPGGSAIKVPKSQVTHADGTPGPGAASQVHQPPTLPVAPAPASPKPAPPKPEPPAPALPTSLPSTPAGNPNQPYKEHKGTNQAANVAVVKAHSVNVKVDPQHEAAAVRAVAHVLSDRHLAEQMRGYTVEFRDLGKRHGQAGGGSKTLLIDHASLKDGSGFAATIIRHELEHKILTAKGVSTGQQESRVLHTAGTWAAGMYASMAKSNPRDAAGFRQAAIAQGVTVNTTGSLDSALQTLDAFLSGCEYVSNAFCPTGVGGGVDPSCSPGGGGSAAGGQQAAQHAARQARIASALSGPIDRAEHLSATQKQEYKAAVSKVISSMSPKALDRMAEAVKRVTYHADVVSLTRSVADRDPAIREWLHSNSAPGRTMVVKGMYTKDTNHLDLDGASTLNGVRSGPEHFMAHEMWHALDKGHAVSNSSEWQQAWHSEMRGERLTRMAGTSPAEAFAEFGRLLSVGGKSHAEVRQAFPRAAAVIERNGLWPVNG